MMSANMQMDAILSNLKENIITRDTFSVADIEALFVETKNMLMTLWMEEQQRYVAPVLSSFQTVVKLASESEEMCICPDKNIRVHV